MYNKGDGHAKLSFYWSKPIAFMPFSLPSPSSLLKLPINRPNILIYIFSQPYGHQRDRAKCVFIRDVSKFKKNEYLVSKIVCRPEDRESGVTSL